MSIVAPTSDSDLLDLLRNGGPLDISGLAGTMEVTPTAVRQRLARLMGRGMVEREVVRGQRGRPRHRYRLSDKGLRLTGSNFSDLARALWSEISEIEEEDVRAKLMERVADSLAMGYAGQVHGEGVRQRMESLQKLLGDRQVAFSVDNSNHSPCLTAVDCPYPQLAEQDRSICTLEKKLFSKLLKQDMQLTECRLDGDGLCRFRTE